MWEAADDGLNTWVANTTRETWIEPWTSSVGLAQPCYRNLEGKLAEERDLLCPPPPPSKQNAIYHSHQTLNQRAIPP